MKVLALTVLLLAIGSLEAGIIKREAPNADQISQMFKSWIDTLQTGAQELANKFQNGEIQAQAGKWLEQTNSQTAPIKAEFEKIFEKILEAGRNFAQ
ncbi:hypothetical protein GDO81_030026 [Engystomops pustulosus]|uniref:Apolipoprotein A-II n=1 Tax=Engystomops pustulosus TaxID=76066 RepID=A0AAV6Z0R5_ENGPU|nr:hypothetical protein GDO81_030026 [Engystomops pustulosus]